MWGEVCRLARALVELFLQRDAVMLVSSSKADGRCDLTFMAQAPAKHAGEVPESDGGIRWKFLSA